MIVFVGGLIGAGKSTIAKMLADAFGCYYYDVDEVKKSFFRTDPDYERNLREGIPFSDATRARMFERVISDLKSLRESHEHVVVDEVLHRRELRHKLFDAAESIFGEFIVVWVQADEPTIIERLKSSKRKNHFLDDPIPMHEAFRREFEDFNRSVIICNNNGTPEEAFNKLQQLMASTASLAGTSGT